MTRANGGEGSLYRWRIDTVLARIWLLVCVEVQNSLHCPVPDGNCGCVSGSILEPSVCPLFMEGSHSPLDASVLKGASKGPFLASLKPSE